MKVRGKISKINTELGYGFVVCAKDTEVFFSTETSFSATSFDHLKVNDLVQVEIIDTERGPFAKALQKDLPKQRTPEISI